MSASQATKGTGPADRTLRDHLQSMDEAMTAGQSLRTLSLHQYINRNGREFTSAPLTPEELETISRIDFRDCRPRDCYRNCQMAAITLPVPEGTVLRYVEGFFARQWSIGIDHAWLSLNGKLIDPTLRDELGRPILGIIPEGHQYIGVEIPTLMCTHIIQHRKHIPLLDDYECGRPLLTMPPEEFTPEAFAKAAAELQNA